MGEVRKVLQDGNLFDAAVLELSTDAILGKFKAAVNIQASLSLGVGVPTSASAPHSVLNGFKNLIAVAAATGYEFPEATAVLSAAASAPAGGAAEKSAAAPKAEEKKEEEENVQMESLF